MKPIYEIKSKIKSLGGLKKARNKVKNEIETFGKFYNGIMKLGYYYSFRYTPKKETYYADLNPLILMLGYFEKTNKVYEIGINLNLIPFDLKLLIIEEYTNAIKNQTNFLMFAKQMYDIIKKSYFSFALRKYIPNKRKSTYQIEPNKYIEVAILKTLLLNKISEKKLNELFTTYKNKK